MKTKLLLMLLAISWAAGNAQANLLVNPSFEEGSFSANATPDGWDDPPSAYDGYYSNMTWFDDAAEAHSGSKYVKMNVLSYGTSAELNQTLLATPDKAYAFNIWAKSAQKNAQREAWGGVDWYDSNGDWISGIWVGGDAVGDEWQYLDFGTYTAPADANLLVVSVWGVVGGVLYDDAGVYGPNPPRDADPNIYNQMIKPPYGAGATGDEVVLNWTNTDPNAPVTDVYVDVWFGTDPNNNNDYTKVVTGGLNTTTVTVDAPNITPPAPTIYYWQVNSYVNGSSSGTAYVFDGASGDVNAELTDCGISTAGRHSRPSTNRQHQPFAIGRIHCGDEGQADVS